MDIQETKQVNFRLKPEEYQQGVELAQTRGITIHEMARRLVVKEIKVGKSDSERLDSIEQRLDELEKELSKK